MLEPIVTPRLRLRRLEPDDAAAVFAYRSDPDVSRYQNWEPESVQEIRSFIDGLATIGPDCPGRWFQLGLILSENEQLIGDCGIHVTEVDPLQAEVGITLAPSFHGRGLASEALEATIDFIFDKLEKHRIFASVDPRNRPSLALMERIGMRKEAHFVESLWFKGSWVDDVVFAVLAREWETRHQGAAGAGTQP